MRPSSGSNPTETVAAELTAAVEGLSGLDFHQLRVRWRKTFRKQAPEHLGRSLLIRIIAYKLQEQAYGGLDRESVRYLDTIAANLKAGLGAKSVPAVPDPRTGKLRPGTLLLREYEGVAQRVAVTSDGFTWNGAAFGSLSEVARAMTGTNWNGPRFFGLRDRPSSQSSANRGESSARGEGGETTRAGQPAGRAL